MKILILILTLIEYFNTLFVRYDAGIRVQRNSLSYFLFVLVTYV